MDCACVLFVTRSHVKSISYLLLSLLSVALFVPKSFGDYSVSGNANTQIVISVAEQRMALVQDGVILKKYPISTSRFGIGDNYGSYKTPVGHLRVCSKIGGGLPQGAVLRGCSPTGEVLSTNAPGRDPIVTRILSLEGTDSSTSHARTRGIYIHGTPVERLLGKPVSYGCIRMRSRDVVEIYNIVPVGTAVTITTDKLPQLARNNSFHFPSSNDEYAEDRPLSSHFDGGAFN